MLQPLWNIFQRSDELCRDIQITYITHNTHSLLCSLFCVVNMSTLVQTKEGMSEICWMDNWRAVLRSLTKKQETSWWHHQWCSLFRFTEGRLGGDQGSTWRRLGVDLEKIKSRIKQIEQRAKCLQSSTHCSCAVARWNFFFFLFLSFIFFLPFFFLPFFFLKWWTHPQFDVVVGLSVDKRVFLYYPPPPLLATPHNTKTNFTKLTCYVE